MERRRLLAATAAATIVATLAFVPPLQAQEPPPVVAITATDGVLRVVENCDGDSTSTLEPITFTLTRAGDTAEELFVDTATLGSIQSIPNVGEGIVIPAGAGIATFEPETGDEIGTVQIEISNSTYPDTFTVGEPSIATGTVARVTDVPDCPAPSTTAPPTTAPPTPPRAEPRAATPDYTG